MKVYLKLFLILLLIFGLSGCSKFSFNNSNNYIKDNNIDTSGNGLAVKFLVSDKYINQKLIDYKLSISNSGLEPIHLNENNFEITTLEAGNIITGFNEFNEKLFKNGELILFHDQNFDPIASGEFQINDDYFKDTTNSKINILLNINYDYSTKINQNVKVNMKNKDFEFQGAISQAAPIQITNIILKPTIKSNIYEIGFYIYDKGINDVSNKIIKITNLELKLGTKELNNCKLLINDNGNNVLISDNIDYSKMIFSKLKNNYIVVCSVDLSDYDDSEIRNTKISGEIDYNYAFTIMKTIKLPEIRNYKNSW